MAINKKLIHFKTKAVFNEKLANNEILDTSIVFIQDSRQIGTHGQLYNCYDQDLIETTYSELKTRRDNSQLIPGAFYRITDYVTTTSQTDTQSAGHPFDVVVLALTENTLADEAYAVHSERDTDGYFASSNLSAWKIWYSLDNDATKFAWASTNGKGVIYRMIDEFNNDVPYDFKNIQVKLNNPIVFCEVSAYGGWFGGKMIRKSEYDKIINDEQYYCWSYKTTSGPGSSGICITKDEQITIDSKLYSESLSEISNVRLSSIVHYVYTFGIGESADLSGNCYNNSIGVYINYGNKQELNRITFGTDCYSNSFGTDCYSNSFGSSCYSNSFGDRCYSNSFEDNCFNNRFGDSYYNNTFGEGCTHNTLGVNCCNNSFGDGCDSNSFGYSCQSNTFGNSCRYNTFGGNCSFNSFGGNCSFNSFGNDFRYNSFGNDCQYNKFQTDSKTGVEKILDYCHNNHFESGCSYNTICTNGLTGSNLKLQNINIHKGVCGSKSKINYINITDYFHLNQSYEIHVFNDEGGNICIDTAPVALTTNDIDLIWNEYFGAGGYGGGSASATALDDIINSIGVGDYDEV